VATGWCREIEVPTLFVTGELEDPKMDGAVLLPGCVMQPGIVPGKWHLNACLESESVMPIVMAFLERYLG